MNSLFGVLTQPDGRFRPTGHYHRLLAVSQGWAFLVSMVNLITRPSSTPRIRYDMITSAAYFRTIRDELLNGIGMRLLPLSVPAWVLLYRVISYAYTLFALIVLQG